MSTFKIADRSTHLSSDTAEFVNSLGSAKGIDGVQFFNGSAGLVVTRAPGRLDVMGGIADYSGSLVLQLPIKNATHAALQKTNSNTIRVLSLGSGPANRFLEIGLSEFLNDQGQPVSYANARKRFSEPSEHWAAYAVGAFLVLMREKHCEFREGASILIRSEVPEGKGVSSSAALEVAVMQAINVAYQIDLGPQEIARLSQKVENLIAGAPCGIMDQMTSACGEENQLLELLCQPDILKGSVSLPAEIELWGIDSGVRHSVGGSDYGTVRTAAFMGYRIIADLAGLQVSPTQHEGKVQITDERWNGYLANVTPKEFENDFASALPERLSGQDFLQRYGGITDHVTHVRAYADYPVRSATKHPIYEHARVQSFASALKDWSGADQGPQLGKLMFESHQSYSECGLGSDATDLLADLVRASAGDGLFGARITGGGSGGTVAVLARAGAQPAVGKVVQRFHERTGHQPFLFSGSSPGAGIFNHLMLGSNS